MADGTQGKRAGDNGYTLELVGMAPGAERPATVVQAIDAQNKILHSEKVGADGSFAIPPEALKQARFVVIGAPEGDGVRSRRENGYARAGRRHLVAFPLLLAVRQRQRARVPAAAGVVRRARVGGGGARVGDRLVPQRAHTSGSV